ncbi:MAG: glycoside hydrolase family 16 protein, partial [Gammaproteobacteria bacterium]|nr:glycoside hydrolase family 16 protein [Gammaproteobacteria bacterium]
NADGAVGRIDNVRIAPESAPIELYGNALADGWYLWDCCGAATFAEVDDDDEHGKVIELSFLEGSTVTGLQATAAMDASSAMGGSLQFDFKEVSPPPDGSQWRVKLESSGAATFAEAVLTDGGNPAPNSDWQSYTFGFDSELPGLDLMNLSLVLFFPDWGNAQGAVARIDNIRLVPTQ